MLNNRSVKLLTIYIVLCIPLHNIFIKKEKYHKFQFCGTYVISYLNFKNIIQQFPIKIASHPYVLLKGTVLCNCGIEAENNFLLKSIAACPGKQLALTMYNTVNTVFMQYFDILTENLEIHISQNWTTQEQVFLISL